MNQPATSKLPKYSIDPLKNKGGESDRDAIERMVIDHAQEGWEIVEACGDEVQAPNLIFERLDQPRNPSEYKVEVVPHAKGHQGLEDVNTTLEQMSGQGWLPLTIFDIPLEQPIGVFRQVNKKPADDRVTAVMLPLGVFEQTEPAIMKELGSQSLISKRTLLTIMHGRLHPVLIFKTSEHPSAEEYLVEIGNGGLFKNAAQTLNDLIQKRANEGWSVCGAFEDELLWPCVVFRRIVAE